MSKKRVHEIAKEFGVESKQVISILQQHNINVTKAVNSVDDSGYEIVKKQLGKKSEAPKVAQKTEKSYIFFNIIPLMLNPYTDFLFFFNVRITLPSGCMLSV